jgi:hypothetical protein
VTVPPLSARAALRFASARASDARIGEQVLDQLLHARGAVDDEAHELGRIALQALAVAALEELRVARDRAQRLLQVVRGDRGELLQLRVGALQLFQRLLALGDVVEDRDLVLRRAVRVAHQRHGEHHPHGRAALGDVALLELHAVKLARAHARALRVGEVAIVRVRDLLHRAADQLLGRVAEHGAQAAVDADEAPVEP